MTRERRTASRAMRRLHPGSRCFYCGRGLDSSNRTRDHVIPQSYGRRQGLAAAPPKVTVPACRKCNAEKADLTLDMFKKRRGVREFPGERFYMGKIRRVQEWWQRYGSLYRRDAGPHAG